MTKLLFGLLLIMSIVGCFSKQNSYKISFERVDGLQEGSIVFNKGFKIGKVTNIDLFANNFLVEVKLNENVKIPEQSMFLIKESVFSASCVEVEYSDSRNLLSTKDTVLGKYQKQAILDNIISDTTKRKEIENSLNKIANGVGDLIETVQDSAKNK
jgi:ABC-type transporter Mla subunit MlaD